MATSTYMARLFAAIFVFAAIVVNVHFTVEPVTSNAPAPAPADLTSLMQGAKVHVERFSLGETPSLSETRQKELAMLTKDVDDVSLFSKAPVKLKSKSKKTPDPVPEITSFASLRSTVHMAASRFTDRLGAKSTGLLSLIGVVLLVALVLVTLTSCMFSFPFRLRSQQGTAGAHGPSPKDIATVLEQRERMLAHTSPIPSVPMYQRSSGAAAGGSGKLWPPGSEQFLRSEPARSGSLMPVPRDIDPMMPPSQSITEQQLRMSVKPPPLCPSLVMPMSEALLGIQMYELAQLSAEGELNIVGISGKPLLRAVVKKVGNARTLEIAMPERNSIPRATIAPQFEAGNRSVVRQGSRALEIRGMRGVFYGTLEMQGSGACYVVKDGQTVFTIDGDAESLQLSLKSSVGLRLASVRCSTELFDGVDHVEIRVEAGVDTVLVVSVVLAVLLLSPYLPPAD